jgi:hypothetical protein
MIRLLAVSLLLAGFSIEAQPVRIRGVVESFDGKTLAVKDAGSVQVGDKTEIIFTQPMSLADIKPGDFLGVTSTKGPGGRLTAYEVRRFPKPLNPGHRPFEGRQDQTMTNATVGAVAQSSTNSANMRELTLTYDGGSQKIGVPQDAAVYDLVPGKPSQLVPGARVNLTHDANKVALRIQVSAPKPAQ